jgi:hypothetical protein
MDTAEAISAADTAQAAAADLPPWAAQEAEPHACSGRLVRHRPVRARQQREMVHWSIVALTLATAASIFLGGHAGASQPKELLPVMITTGLR